MADIVHLQLAAHDADRTAAFYGAWLGWQAAPVNDRYAMLHDSADGPSVGLAEEREVGVVMTLAVEDLEAAVARAVELGATPVSPPVDVPGIGRVASIRDPEGRPVMLVPRDQPARDGVVEPHGRPRAPGTLSSPTDVV